MAVAPGGSSGSAAAGRYAPIRFRAVAAAGDAGLEPASYTFSIMYVMGVISIFLMYVPGIGQREGTTPTWERVKAALHVLKHCQSEAARIEYGIVLAALAPERLGVRDPKGIPVGGAPLGVVARVRRAAAAAET